MSLLNDALKRASQSQQGHDTVRITLPPAVPAAKLHTGRGSSLSVLVMLLIVAAGVTIAVAFLFFGMRGKTASHVTATTTTATTATTATTTPATIPAPATVTVPPPAHVVVAAPKPVRSPVRTKPVAVSAHAHAPAPVQAYTPAPPPTPDSTSLSMATLKLQGITYYNGKWQAIVNGATVYVGDNVEGFRVAQISQNHVSFIAPDGSRRLVPLGQ